MWFNRHDALRARLPSGGMVSSSIETSLSRHVLKRKREVDDILGVRHSSGDNDEEIEHVVPFTLV